MAHCINNSLSVLLLLLFTAFSHSSSLRRRSAQNPYDLSDALDVLQRQRRRIDEHQYRRENLDILRNRFSPYDALDLYNERPSSVPDKITLADILEQYPEYLDAFKEQIDQESENNAKQDKAESKSTNKPSLEELKEMLGSEDSDSTKSENKEETTAKEKKEQETPESLNTDAQNTISESKMTQLLNEVEKEKTGNKDQKNDKKESETRGQKTKDTNHAKPITKDELQNMFSDTEQSNSDGTTLPASSIDDSNGKEQSPNKLENIESARKIPDNSDSNTIVMRKRNAKRSNPPTERTVAELEDQIDTLRDELVRLRLVEELEDRENDYLAAALKEATMAQLQGRDRFLKSEYGDIQNAIDVEEVLQDVKTSNNGIVDDEMAAAEELAEAENDAEDEDMSNDAILEAKKRSSKDLSAVTENLKDSYEDGMGRWFEKPIPEEDEDGDIEGDEDAQDVLENFVQNYMDKGHKSEEPEADGSELMQLEKSSDADDDIVINEGDVDRVINNYLLGLETPSNEDEQEEEDDEENEVCPTLELFSSGCKVADTLGLPIDFEARNLCNRHEICYACGATLEMSQLKCDSGFRSEVIQICGANKNCIRDGAEFLWLIKGDHRYNYGVMDQCAHACVEDYIVGS